MNGNLFPLLKKEKEGRGRFNGLHWDIGQSVESYEGRDPQGSSQPSVGAGQGSVCCWGIRLAKPTRWMLDEGASSVSAREFFK